MKITAFWDVMPYSLVQFYSLFWRTMLLPHAGYYQGIITIFFIVYWNTGLRNVLVKAKCTFLKLPRVKCLWNRNLTNILRKWSMLHVLWEAKFQGLFKYSTILRGFFFMYSGPDSLFSLVSSSSFEHQDCQLAAPLPHAAYQLVLCVLRQCPSVPQYIC